MTERQRNGIERKGFHLFGFSHYRYALPVKLDNIGFYPNSPEHEDRFKHAVDIATPNPNLQETVIVAPASGYIEALVMHNTTWGPGKEFVNKLNYINVSVGGNEFYEVAHIAPIEGKELRFGMYVERGEEIAKVALNGRITVDNNGEPDTHVHILVGRWFFDKKERGRNFRSLRIRWE